MQLGEVIAILVDDEADIAAFANYKGEDDAPAQEAPVATKAAPAKPAAPKKSYPDHIVLEMPNLSPTMEKGNIASWHKQVGDKVSPGEALCGIETDKAVVDFEMQEEGYVAKILYPAGTKDVDLGKPVAILVDDESDIAAFADWTEDSAAGGSEPEPVQETAQPSSGGAQKAAAPQAKSGDRKFASPLARRTAAEKGVDLSNVTGTGPRDRIVLADVEDALKAGPVVTAAPTTGKVAKDVEVKKVAPPQKVDMPDDMFSDIKVSQIRKVIAERLTHSK